MPRRPRSQPYSGFYDLLRNVRHSYDPEQISVLLNALSQQRTDSIANLLATYIATNLPNAINRRDGLMDYRTNPYVLLASASVMNLSSAQKFAEFLFNNKLYMGLETSFGKSIESVVVGHYPISGNSHSKWIDPPEKLAEFGLLEGIGREERARRRTTSVWREIDKSCTVGKRRFLVTIKSGPNCINDTQVEGMKSAIVNHHKKWMAATTESHPQVEGLDIVVGITYGTACTTNNKENQILVKLLEHGFEEEDRENRPGVLVDSETRKIRVYRAVGQEFWSFIGCPQKPANARAVFLEVLLAVAKALSLGKRAATLEDRLNAKIRSLSNALANLTFPSESLPTWIKNHFSEDELFWLATGLTAFYDEGI